VSVSGGAVFNTGTVANPGPMLVDHQGKFLYLVNQGPNLTPTSSASSVSAFFINTTGVLSPLSIGANASTVPFGSGSEPQCILEDPSNQYLYTANYADSTVTGAIINSATGTLTNLRKATAFGAAGQPTWCTLSGTTF
jgi:6-phosphogluconolactonase